MKKIIVLLSLLMIVIVMTGCDLDEGDILDIVIGSAGSSSSSSNQQSTPAQQQNAPQDNNNNNNVPPLSNLDNMPLPEPFCEPHGRFDGVNCICDAGYVSDGTDCIPGGRECTYDDECGIASCSGDYKIVPRCDLRTYKCSGSERVNCKTEFGAEYRCVYGSCTKG